MPPTVLIVADHPTFRTSARLLLEAEGYDVIGEAGDGANARRSSLRQAAARACRMTSLRRALIAIGGAGLAAGRVAIALAVVDRHDGLTGRARHRGGPFCV